MNKKIILTILFLMLFSIGGLTVYNTFAYNEEASLLEQSKADYNLIYYLKEKTNKHVTVSSKETKYIDIELNNTYTSNVKYGMYYYLVKPNNIPDNVTISLSEDSINPVEDIIKSSETKIVSIKIINNSDNDIELIIGALIGFENGDIKDLVKNGEILIK